MSLGSSSGDRSLPPPQVSGGTRSVESPPAEAETSPLPGPSHASGKVTTWIRPKSGSSVPDWATVALAAVTGSVGVGGGLGSVALDHRLRRLRSRQDSQLDACLALLATSEALALRVVTHDGQNRAAMTLAESVAEQLPFMMATALAVLPSARKRLPAEALPAVAPTLGRFRPPPNAVQKRDILDALERVIGARNRVKLLCPSSLSDAARELASADNDLVAIILRQKLGSWLRNQPTMRDGAIARTRQARDDFGAKVRLALPK